MEFMQLKCESCGGEIELDKEQITGFCKYCGSKVIRKTPDVQKVKIEEPVKIDGKVELVNNEFEAKLAQTELAIDIYLQKKKPTIFDYNNVVRMLDSLETIGANDSRFYMLFVKFFIRANFEGFETGMRRLISKTQFLSTYDICMKNAIKYSKNPEEKAEIEKKYNEERSYVEEKLNYYEKNKKNFNKNSIKICIFVMIIYFIILGIIISST